MIYVVIFVSIVVFGILLNILSNKLIINYYNKTKTLQSNLAKSSSHILAFFIQTLKLDVKIQKHGHDLDNFYSIKHKIIVLSEEVFPSSSLAAIGISMHEFGHALQHHNKSPLFYTYIMFSFLSRISSIIFLPAIIFLIVSLFLDTFFLKLAMIIVTCLYVINLFSRIIIIPVEKDASNRAIKLLKDYNILDHKELKIVKKLLNVACFTYVGGFFKNYRKILRNILRGF